MIAQGKTMDLVERLPAVRGRYSLDVDLSRTTWFRAGGRADVVFRPADIDDLAHFLASRPADVPVTVIGLGSNLLVRDGGVEGVVIRLRQGFRDVDVRWEGDRALVEVGAGALDVNVARHCRDQGVDGLAFLSGIPGSIGGALRMNAGAYGREIGDVVVSAEAIDRAGGVHRLDAAALGLGYRTCAVPEGWIFVEAVLRGEPGTRAAIAARMAEISGARNQDQPVRERTGGSTFRNPTGRSAWELIEEAGCRGLTRGGAQVSPLHCNFLINTGGATAADLEDLGEEVRAKVEAATGIRLEWEIRRVGVAREPDRG